MKKEHPFPMYIEAHAGSNVIVGCSGETVIATGEKTDAMEAEMLRVFRKMDMRERVQIMNDAYCLIEKRKKARPADVGKAGL